MALRAAASSAAVAVLGAGRVRGPTMATHTPARWLAAVTRAGPAHRTLAPKVVGAWGPATPRTLAVLRVVGRQLERALPPGQFQQLTWPALARMATQANGNNNAQQQQQQKTTGGAWRVAACPPPTPD
jgi:hypothetical protein